MKAWAKSFYLSAAWEKTRAAYLMSQDYICERCGQPAKIVHHKRWLNRENINDISVTLCWDNLEALCQDCHNKEHHRGERKKRYSFDANGNLVYPPPFAAELGRAKHRGREVKKTPQARA